MKDRHSGDQLCKMTMLLFTVLLFLANMQENRTSFH